MKNIFLKSVLLLTILFIGCSKDDDSSPDNAIIVDFEEAFFTRFPLSEVDLEGEFELTISNPPLLDGMPDGVGIIDLKIPYDTEATTFSLKEVDFDDSQFTISPAVGEVSIVLNETVTYTITSIEDPSLSMQYEVFVSLLPMDPIDEELNLVGFSFLKEDNNGLTEDISSTEIRSHDATQPHDATVVMIVPNGTDFSDLIPSINYEGSTIKYHTDANGNSTDFEKYEEGTSLDFKFPNIITFRIYNSDESNFMEFKVLVDVQDPIVFDEESVLIKDGDFITRYNTLSNVVGFTNEGNYPITSEISFTNIEVTETPEETPQNYYNLVLLEENSGDIETGVKGSLFLELNFPGSFSGSFNGTGTYTVEVEFVPVLEAETSARIRGKQTEGLPDRDDHFEIYNSKTIELKANVFVTND